MRRKALFLSFVLLFMALSSALPIHLKSEKLNPGEGLGEEISERKNEGISPKIAGKAGKEDFLLQFRKPSNESERINLERKENLKFKSYIPENAWIVSANPNNVESLVRRGGIRNIAKFKPGYKISSRFKNEMEKQSGDFDVRVSFFERKQREEVITVFKEKDIRRRLGSKSWRVSLSRSQIEKISERNDVERISRVSPKPQSANQDARDIIEVDQVHQPPYNLKGEGFTAAEWDSGWAGNHSDLNYSDKLIIGDRDCTEENCKVDDHATHVAGTMLGKGNIDSTYKGVAPDARLASYEWPTSGSSELYSETNESIVKYGAILSQNSWGFPPSDCSNSNLYGDYGYWNEKYDSILSNETSYVDGTLSIVFSAMNERDECSKSYNTSVAPSTAKNVISVGSVNDQGQMTVYSSWGPTDDGRIKPDVVANGGDCYQIKSTLPTDRYGEYCGTSMAAPAVSGSVVLLNQQFNRTYSELPNPATVKGVLIHTSKDLKMEGPDYSTGWGLVNTTKAINYVNSSDDRSLIRKGELNGRGEKDSFTVTVPEGEQVDFTLVWNDYPGNTLSGKALVNDLDLVVENRTGGRKYPWTISWSNRTEGAVQTQKDSKNPVEQVSVSSASTSSFNVTVNATKLPEPSQKYSLLMSRNSAPAPKLDIKSPKNKTYGKNPSFNVTVNDAVVDVNYSVNGSNNSLIRKNSTYFYKNRVDLDGKKSVKFYAENVNGHTIAKKAVFTVDTEPPLLNISQPDNNANVSGNFSLNATWEDDISSVSRSKFTIYNSTYRNKGELNTTLNSSSFRDGGYRISFNVSDDFNNSNTSIRNITVDNSAPAFRFSSLDDGDIRTSGNLAIDAGWRDSLTGVESASYKIQNQSFLKTGGLNGTIDESELSNSIYNLTYILKDYADNLHKRRVEVRYDTEGPSLETIMPSNNSVLKDNFSLKVFSKDKVSGIEKINYSLFNDSRVTSGRPNETVNTSNISTGNYRITLAAHDNAGISNTAIINITLDKESPKINITSPKDGTRLKGNFSINATYSDDLSIREIPYKLRNETVQKRGSLNTSINSSKLRDGSYNISANVTDIAGRFNSTLKTVKVDNTAPKIKGDTVGSGSNLSGIVDLNFTFEENGKIDYSEFRLVNNSGNLTDWEELNYSDFNTSDFSDGEYNISVRSNDSLGNNRVKNFTSIKFDNTSPHLTITEYNASGKYKGWIRDNATVELTCSDSGTGVKKISALGNKVENREKVNINRSGEHQYKFRCQDYEGNIREKLLTYRVDANKPFLKSISPQEGENTPKTVDIDAEIFNESMESGLNTSQSYISTTEGNIEVEFTDTGFSSTVSGLESSESYTIEGKLVDNVGHSYQFSNEYSVEKDSKDSSSSGGGIEKDWTSTQASSSSSDDSENETEAGEEEFSSEESGDNESLEDKDNNSTECSIVAADTDGTECRRFSSCSASNGWIEVEDCETWERERAEQLLNSISKDSDQYSRAHSHFENEEYEKAIRKALSARNNEREPNRKIGSYITLLLAAISIFTMIFAIFILYRRRRRKNLLSHIEKSTEELALKLEENNNLTREEKRKLSKAFDEVENGNYKDAKIKLEAINSN